MTVHHARVVALAVVLIGMGACGPSERPGEQQTLDEQRGPEAAPLIDLPHDEPPLVPGIPAQTQSLGDRIAEVRAQIETTQLPASELMSLADQGDVFAQFHLGQRHERGEFIWQTDAGAVLWYRRAVDKGHAGAQFHLGNMYQDGRGIPQDYSEAARLFGLAADQGHSVAQRDLGLMVAGLSPTDWEESRILFSLRARDGERTERNLEAHMWLNLAAAQLTGEDRDLAVKGRDIVAEHMTADQLAEAQRRAREWTPTPEP